MLIGHAPLGSWWPMIERACFKDIVSDLYLADVDIDKLLSMVPPDKLAGLVDGLRRLVHGRE